MSDELTEKKLDILVEGEVVLELKAVTKRPDVATAQALSYLKATTLRLTLLINFSRSRLVDGIKRLSL